MAKSWMNLPWARSKGGCTSLSCPAVSMGNWRTERVGVGGMERLGVSHKQKVTMKNSPATFNHNHVKRL